MSGVAATAGGIGLVTCAAYPNLTSDDQALQEALASRGVPSSAVAWNDPSVDWTAFDAVVLRSTWDYHLHYHAFRAWTDRLHGMPVALVNPWEAVRWNADKRYLLELAALGVDVIPTQVVAGGDLDAHIAKRAGEMLVVKPTISGNSWHTFRGHAGSDAFARGLKTLPITLEYLVQPYLPEVESHGEWSVVYFNGRFCHAVRKLPTSGDYRVQPDFGGISTAATPGASVMAGANACLAALNHIGLGNHVYARIDGIVRNSGFLLMEVELIEPHLFLRSSADAPGRFADAILEAIERHDRLRDVPMEVR